MPSWDKRGVTVTKSLENAAVRDCQGILKNRPGSEDWAGAIWKKIKVLLLLKGWINHTQNRTLLVGSGERVTFTDIEGVEREAQ